MKYITSLFVAIILSFSFFGNITNAGIFSGGGYETPYEQDCGSEGCLEAGLNSVNKIDGLVTEQKASEYIQNIVKYVLGFLYLISVIIIIYAGFNLLTSVGDEEKAKKTKTMIIYVIVGLLIIFFAGPITEFMVDMFYGN